MAETEQDDDSLLLAPGPVRAMLVIDDGVLRRLGPAVRHLCVGMMDEAIQMTVLSRSVPSAAGEMIGPSRVVVPPRGWLPWTRRPSAERLSELLGGWRPQVVHCLSASLAHWAREWAAAWNCALVVQLTDLKDVRGLGEPAYAPNVAAVTTTKVLERALLKAHPQLEGRVRTISFGIPGGDEIACYAHPENIPAAIVTAPLEHGSGLELVLKALHAVAETGQEVHLFVLSDGPDEPAFRRQLDRLRLRALVTFAGGMSDAESLRAAMAGSDLFVMPVVPERFNLHALLALATGLAVVAPMGAIDDYLIDGQTARLFEPRVSDLADKWLGLLQDREAARQLAGGGQEYVRTHHQASVMVGATAVLYRQAIARQTAMAGSPVASDA